MITLEEMYGTALQYALDKATEVAVDSAVRESVAAWVGRKERKASESIREELRATWGPERTMLRNTDSDASRPAFNCHSANPNYGDERIISIAKNASDTSAGGWRTICKVEGGQTYFVRLYYHNSADPSVLATGARAMCGLPSRRSTKTQVTTFIAGDNTSPPVVWSNLLFEGVKDQPFILRYMPGSTQIYTNKVPAGQQLGDDICTERGVLLGDEMDGAVAGGYGASGILTFRLAVE